jgi:hypothetical protein
MLRYWIQEYFVLGLELQRAVEIQQKANSNLPASNDTNIQILSLGEFIQDITNSALFRIPKAACELRLRAIENVSRRVHLEVFVQGDKTLGFLFPTNP